MTYASFNPFAIFVAAVVAFGLVFFGFVGPVGLIATAHAGRPWMAWGLDAGYQPASHPPTLRLQEPS